ncbi:MAG: hypothetical protein K5851_07055 [Lachnospiraceae bacterium]|nr:hypothetical protein [Lachnospiraceae bacterium]
MLKNDRVIQMTKMAMFEKRNRSDLRIATEYRRRDYISMSRIVSFIIGSIAFALFYVGLVAFVLYNMTTGIHTRFLVLVLMIGIVLYVLFMYFYMRRVIVYANREYRRSKGVYAKWRQMLLELMKIYEDEEKEQEEN